MEKTIEIRYLEHELGIELFVNSDKNIYSSLKLNKTVIINDVQKVIGLNLSYCKLKNLKVLNKFIDVEYLYLSNNEIVDLNLIKDFKKLKILDLSYNKIENIDSISNLVYLEILNLSDNKISELPLLNCPRLIELYAARNRIKSIENLKKLSSIFSLNFDDNLIDDITVLASLTSLKNISLESNKLKQLNGFNKFTSFIRLNLSKNLIEDITDLSGLEIIEELFIGENKIYDLSPLYFSLKKDKINFVNASGNPLIYPPFEVVQRGENLIVEWFDTIIKSVNQILEINNNKRDTILDIGGMGLTDLNMVPKLFDLEHLEELIISNEWAEYDEINDRWKLDGSKNKILKNNIKLIPSEISKLKNLKKIIAGGDWKGKNDKNYNKWRIKDISALFSLKRIEFLNLSNNEIENISGLTKLKNIQIAHLNNNEISHVPKLKNLKKLREIYLSNNLISDVDFLEESIQIETVDLHSNKIQDLLPLEKLLQNSNIEIKNSSWEKKCISVSKNSRNINPPYEILNLGKNDFFLYLRQLDYENKLNLDPYYNKEIKVVLVGNSYSGKSTFLNYLKTKRFKKGLPSTHWLVTEELKNIKIGKEELKLRFFDFGGQDYYHDTHKMFFSSDSIYLLLWDEKSNFLGKIKDDRNDSNEEIDIFPLEYWLDSIKIFAKKSLSESERQIEQLLDERDRKINSKVRDPKRGNWINDVEESNEFINKIFDSKNILIIQNKIDLEKGYLDQSDLISKYPNIYDFVNISILDKKGTSQFQEHYIDILKRNLNYNRPLLTTWGIIKDNLKDVFDGTFIISIDDFKKHVNNYLSIKLKENYNKSNTEISSILFKDDEEIVLFANFLCEIGLIIFDSKNEKIKNTIIVNQNRFLEIVSEILNIAKSNEGKIDKAKLYHIEYIDETIQILILHNIIFEDIYNENYIAPLFLPEKPNFLVDLLVHKTIPYRRFKFEGFIPKSIMLSIFSLIAGKENKSDEDFYFWKNGLIFKNKNDDKVLLQFNIGTNLGFAFIDVFNLEKEDSIFAEEIVCIVRQVMEAQCNGYKEYITFDDVFFANYNVLKFNYKNQISYIEVIDLENKVIKHVSTFKYNDFMDEDLKKPTKKIFISYSKFDDDYRKEFVKHLVTLRDEGLIEDFNCEEIDLGDNSHNVIQKELLECDYMIALVSVDFLNTEYIRKFEVEKAKELGKKIIPIIIKPCDWENSIVKDFHASLRGTNISLNKELFLKDKFKETSEIERHAWWTKIIKELRSKIFSKVKV